MTKIPSVLSLLLVGGGLFIATDELLAQQIPVVPSSITQAGITVSAPAKGETQNLSVTNGSRTALSVGNSTSFGASTNLTLSSGLTGISRTSLVPSSVAISSKIGDNALQQTKIDISNLSAQGQGGSITPVGTSAAGGTIDLQEGTQYASGNAYIEGMGASVDLKIDPGDPARPGDASFYSSVHPYVVDERTYRPFYDQDGKLQQGTVTTVGCTPNPGSSTAAQCAFMLNELVSGNAGASANLSTTTNIDINANSFVNTFAQSF